MLADFLDGERERLIAATLEAAASDAPVSRDHVTALIDELVASVRAGRFEEQPAPFPCREREREDREREGLRRVVVREVAQLESAVPLAELLVLTEWSYAVERRRLREENRCLWARLDAVRGSSASSLEQRRLELLAKVSGLVGLRSDELLPALARLAIPELADWSVLDMIEGGLIRRSFVGHRDPTKTAVREVLMRERPGLPTRWMHELSAGESVLVPQVAPDDLRDRAPSEEHYRVMAGLGVRSMILVPIWREGELRAIAGFATTDESGRRYGPGDVLLAEEMVRRAVDVVRNVRLQEDLSQAVKFREQVMGVLGHDLRNPLNAIIMAAQLVARLPDVPESARERAVRIEHAANRMGEMIRTLLDFTHARFRGGVPIAPAAADLGTVARETVAELRSAWPDRDLDFEARGDLRGEWDAPRIAQVVSNLVANAISHGAPTAPVRVLAADEGAEVRLAVHNHGAPIPPALFPVLFEPFRRGADDRGGLGLGLYIAHQIVDAHGGRIEVTSTAAAGTCFTVRLPRVVARAALTRRQR